MLLRSKILTDNRQQTILYLDKMEYVRLQSKFRNDSSTSGSTTICFHCLLNPFSVVSNGTKDCIRSFTSISKADITDQNMSSIHFSCQRATAVSLACILSSSSSSTNLSWTKIPVHVVLGGPSTAFLVRTDFQLKFLKLYLSLI